jgi:tetratricopeptide (TPR) repeat protein
VLTNQPAEGRVLLERHLTRNPRNADVIILLAELDIAAHDYAAAERNYLHALEVNSDHFGAYSRLALIYAKQHRLDEGRQKYEQIIARQPKDTVARTMVAVLLQLQHRTDEAIRQYEQILQIDKRSGVAANNLAYLYADRGTNLDMALQLAQTAKQELPDVTGVTDTLGWVYYKKKLSAQAIAAFEEITRAEPQNAIYYYHLGLAHTQAGDAVRARRALEETLKLQPNSAEAGDARKVLATLQSAS